MSTSSSTENFFYRSTSFRWPCFHKVFFVTFKKHLFCPLLDLKVLERKHGEGEERGKLLFLLLKLDATFRFFGGSGVF